MRMSKDPNVFNMPQYKRLVTDDMVKSIRKVRYFSEGHYSNLEIAETLEFYTNRYVRQIFDFTPINNTVTVADIGAGFGWLCMAFAYTTNANLIAIEPNKARLDAGKEIANILGNRRPH